ncbi:MAG TPA: NYN domain-containing protein [Roseiflexaceae bacterium]|nr:NYN domain-containing protein [Roseiflexaceae bacterium]
MTDEQLWFIRNIVAPCLKALRGSAARPTRPALPAVALLIDGENCPPDLAGAALNEAAKHGPVPVRRVYANWSVASQRWIEPIARHNIRPIHHQPAVPRKNAIDIALVVDAMDLLHAGVVSCFCLVASDSDYTPLVTRLCAAGRTVVVFGKANTPQALVQACSLFVPLERLGAPPEPPAPEQPPAQPPARDPAPPAPKPPAAPAPAARQGQVPASEPPKTISAAQRQRLRNLLLQAWKSASKQDGWLFAGALGQQLKQVDPSFDPKTYGYSRLGLLLADHTDLFELRSRGIGQYDVRLINR